MGYISKVGRQSTVAMGDQQRREAETEMDMGGERG
jgi:hypothetical protein